MVKGLSGHLGRAPFCLLQSDPERNTLSSENQEIVSEMEWLDEVRLRVGLWKGSKRVTSIIVLTSASPLRWVGLSVGTGTQKSPRERIRLTQ